MKDDGYMEAPSPERREFMKRSGAAVAGVGVMSGGVLFSAATETWAARLSTLNAVQAKTLLRMARDIYPHDQMRDDIYQVIVDNLDAAAEKDGAMNEMLVEGVKDLNLLSERHHGREFAALEQERDRVALLQQIESTPFFQKVRGDMITGIYNNPDVWKILGYEGASAHLGGYLKRGFDDINWL